MRKTLLLSLIGTVLLVQAQDEVPPPFRVTTERVVDEGALGADGDALQSVPIHRMLTDGVAETPGGAHFTANPPDYGRDESFQKEYAASASDPAEWDAFARRYVDVSDAEYRAHVDERVAP